MPPPGRATNGKFVGTEENLRRDAEALRLRSRGWTYQRIADELGYHDRRTAYRAVEQALKETLQEPADDLRKLELDRLDRMWEAAEKVLERHHVTVSQGCVVRIEGEPLEDDAPVLQALDRLLKIQERRARLLGLDAPSRSRVEVVTQDQIEAAIEDLNRQIAEQERELANGTGSV